MTPSPLEEKRVVNELFAERYGRKTKKGVRRKLRHLRVIQREQDWLTSVGVDPAEAGTPVA